MPAQIGTKAPWPLTSQAECLRLISGILPEGEQMTREPKRISTTEFALLRLLWDRGQATIRELTEALYPESNRARYATVQSLLGRLEAKGYVGKQRAGRLNLFQARVTRGDLTVQRLRRLARELWDGSPVPLVSQLTGMANLSPEETQALRRLIERLSESDAAAGQGKQDDD